MAGVIGKIRDRWAILVLIAISSIGFVNLWTFPPFVDEAVHLWWVWRIIEAGDWLRPFGVGKPLEAWLAVPIVQLGGDALTEMRILHVVAGIVSTILVYLLASRITTSGAAFVSGVLTAVCPFVVHLERLALAEIYLCAAGLLTLLGVLRFCQTRTRGGACLMGIGLVLAAFAKFPIGFVFMASLPASLILLSKSGRAQLLEPKARLRWLVAYAPVVLLLCAVVGVATVRVWQGATPGFGLDLLGTQVQTADRIATIAGNSVRVVGDLAIRLTWPVVGLIGTGIVFSLLRGSEYQRWVTIMGLAPLVGIVLVSGQLMSRYLLFAVPPLIVGAVCGWHSLLQPRRALRAVAAFVLVAACVILMGYQSALIVFKPTLARGLEGYVSGWTSGYGYPELARYLQSSPSSFALIYAFEVGTAMQLRSQLPGEWMPRVQQLQIVNGKYLAAEEAQAYLLTQSPTWLVTPYALDDRDAFVATHLRRRAGFSKPNSDVQVTLYEVRR